MSEPAIRIVRVLPAPPEEVFDAWTDPQAMRIWMCPGDIFESVVELDLRVGGRFSINMRSPRGDDVHTGEYLAIERPHRLSFTWTSAGTRGRQTVVTIELRARGDGGCELTLTHDRLRDDAVPQHRVGWKAHLRELFGYLERGAGPGAG